MNEITSYVLFCDWHILISTMFLRFIYVVACVRISLLLNTGYYSIVCIYVLHFGYLFTCWWARVTSTFWLLWIILLWTWVYKNLVKLLVSIILDIYSKVELLDHINSTSNYFWWVNLLLPLLVAQFYILTKSTVDSNFYTSFPTLVIFFIFG